MTEPLRVLIVEDSETDTKLVARELRRISGDLVYERVETEDEMRRALRDRPWSLVVSDWSLPGFSAKGALDVLNATGLDIPFIIVSGTIGEEEAVDAMRAGARDFVLKDRLARLGPAVERELRELDARRSHERATRALLEAEARLARLSESGIIGIAYADLTGHLNDANDAYLQMLGYTRADVARGLTWADLSADPWTADHPVTEQLRTTGVALPWQQDLLHKDGTRVPVLIGVAMLDDVHAISFVADLSALKRTEAALERTERQLRQAQKMEAIGLLAGGVAHDFNNLLSVILGYAGLAIGQLPAGDPMRASLAEIYRAGERAADLTRQLLAFSRRQVMRLQPLELGRVLEGMSSMLRRLLGEDVELVISTAPDLGLARLDRGQIEQVLMNLVVNARDAMPRGGKLLLEAKNVTLDEHYVATHVGARRGPHVMLAVTDSGCGIDSVTMARIFEPFFTTKAIKGTGLGLSTVLGIVEQSGGTIWVYSEVGVGTTFKLYFPRVEGTAADVPPESEVDIDELGGSETILLAEDDAQVRGLASAILRRHGYQILEAQSGGDAILIGEQHDGAISLLVTDVVMPRLSGRELAERLLARWPDMRTLYMSGYTDDAVVRHGVLEAEVAFLQKPFTERSLVAKVRETLDKRVEIKPRS